MSLVQLNPGCYVDGSRGIYAIDAIVSFAKGLGFVPDEDNGPYPDSLADYEWANEVEDETDEYLNHQYRVAGHSWGRNENGDWGLWADDDE